MGRGSAGRLETGSDRQVRLHVSLVAQAQPSFSKLTASEELPIALALDLLRRVSLILGLKVGMMTLEHQKVEN